MKRYITYIFISLSMSFPINATETDIEEAIATPGLIQNFITAPGKISIHPEHIAHVNSKVNGIVKEIKKHSGEMVEKNDTLALIESQEMAEAKTSFFSAQKKLELANIVLQREEKLRGISAGDDYLNAKLAENEAHLYHELAKQKLLSLGLSEQEILSLSSENLRLYELKSPIKGRILEKELSLGELIQNQKVFTIADFEKVIVEINVNQNDLKHLQEGLRITLTGCIDKSDEAKIDRIYSIINEETRRATVIASLENEKKKWAPGEFVTAHIQTTSIEVPVLIPYEAIQRIDGTDHVFVKQQEHFVPQAITIGKKDDKNVEVLSGLEAGQTYASQHTFLLKAKCQQEEEVEN